MDLHLIILQERRVGPPLQFLLDQVLLEAPQLHTMVIGTVIMKRKIMMMMMRKRIRPRKLKLQ